MDSHARYDEPQASADRRSSRCVLVPVVFILLLGAACNEDSQPVATEATSDGIEVGAGPADPEAMAAFRGQRNAICTEGSVKVGEVPDATSGEPAADIMAGLRHLEQRVEDTQAALADLDVETSRTADVILVLARPVLDGPGDRGSPRSGRPPGSSGGMIPAASPGCVAPGGPHPPSRTLRPSDRRAVAV